MNIDLEKTFNFTSILVNADQDPFFNTYEARICMRTESENAQDYNIAYKRMKFWFYDIMDQCVLIEHNDPRVKIWQDTALKCLSFPTQPVDQVVGMMLMSKIKSIVEDRVSIQRISVSSPADDFIYYHCDGDDELHWFEEPGWWKNSGPMYNNDSGQKRRTDKVISLSRTTEWKQYDLEWYSEQENTANVTLISSFDRDDKE
jgi:hypothetical protein